MRQLDTEEGGGVGGHGSRERGAESGEEGLEAAVRVDAAHDAANGDVALGGLQPALDCVDGEDGNPHGDTGGGTGGGDGGQGDLSRALAGDGVLGGETALDVLVGGEVGGGARAVTGEGSGGAAEDGAQATLGIELADDVVRALVARRLAGLELLGLDLEDDLDALKGSGDGRHGNGGEEAGSGGLADREGLRGGVFGVDAADNVLAEVVGPEGDGDWRGWSEEDCLRRPARQVGDGRTLTHGGHANEGRRDTGVQTTAEAIASNALPDNVNGGRVDALVGGLQADLDEIEGVADNDGTDTTKATGSEGAQLGGASADGLFRIFLGLSLGLGDVRDLVGNSGRQVRLDCLVNLGSRRRGVG